MMQLVNLLILLSTAFATADNSDHGSVRRLRGNKDRCRALVRVEKYDPSHVESDWETSLGCELSDGTILDVKGISGLELDALVKNGKLKSGKSMLDLTGKKAKVVGKGKSKSGTDVPGTVMLYGPPEFEDDHASNAFGHHHKRQLSATEGTRKVLVVRVKTPDAPYPPFSQKDLRGDVFGLYGDPVNLADQYAACSNNKLQFVRASSRQGQSININSGVVTVTVNVATNEGHQAMVHAIHQEIKAQFGVIHPKSLTQHAMYCLPEGTMSGIAYAYVNHWLSVYSGEWCSSASIQMHELGHNLGLAHSNENGNTYHDQTGMMGYSYNEDDGPKMCFNAAKYWQLGWLGSEQEEIHESSLPLTNKQIEGIAGTWGDGIAKVLKLSHSNNNLSESAYLLFNWAHGFNVGTKEGADKVVIAKRAGDGTDYAESDLIAKLDAGTTYVWVGYYASGCDLEVLVHSTNVATGLANLQIRKVC